MFNFIKSYRNPEFTQDKYNFRIKENWPIGKVFGKIEAHDGDELDVVRYYTPENSVIAVDDISGSLFTAAVLDFEKQKSHFVVVTARDNATGAQRVSTATVVVELEDIEDEPPVIQEIVTFTL